MASLSAEIQIERIVRDQNRPFGLQQLVDLGATTGFKKAQVSKAIDNLVAEGKILSKACCQGQTLRSAAAVDSFVRIT